MGGGGESVRALLMNYFVDHKLGRCPSSPSGSVLSG